MCMYIQMWVQARERKCLEERCVCRTEGWRWPEHPAGWLLALRTKLKKGFLFRKITSQKWYVVSEHACASSSVRGTALDPGLALWRLRCTDTFLHVVVQNPLGLRCGRSLPTFLHGTEPPLLLFTLKYTSE